MTQQSFEFEPMRDEARAVDEARVAEASDDGDLASPDTMSIAEAVRAVNDAMHAGLGGLVWLRGELHNANVSKGHRYFDLVDDAAGAADVRQRAKVSAQLFANAYQRIAPRLERAGVKLAEGLCVRMRGSFEVYALTGRLSFKVVDIDPEFTVGNLAVRRDALLRTLSNEGLLEANRRLAMPLVPLRAGVVTSPGAEGWRDFRSNLDESGIGFRVDLAPARLQGTGAPVQLANAIRRLSARDDLDVIAVVRGGGSKSDLATFDHEYVARAIAACSVPVVTGIGHDNDRSIADEVAHTACKTPTACAQLLIDRVRDFRRVLDDRAARLAHVGERRLVACTSALNDRRSRVRHAAGRAVDDSARRLTARSRGLVSSTRRNLRAASSTLDTASEQVASAAPRALVRAASRVDLVAALVEGKDPAIALRRGWSITLTADGNVLRSVADAAPGDLLSTRVRDGQVRSTVTGVDADRGVQGDG